MVREKDGAERKCQEFLVWVTRENTRDEAIFCFVFGGKRRNNELSFTYVEFELRGSC